MTEYSILIVTAVGYIASFASILWAIVIKEKCRYISEEKLRAVQENEALKKAVVELENELQSAQFELIETKKEKEFMEASHASVQDLISQTKEQLIERMKGISSEVLTSTQSYFLSMAKAQFDESQKRFQSDCDVRDEKVGNLLQPLRQALDHMDKKVEMLEASRKETHGSLIEQLNRLTRETSFLHRALRHPSERGRWGEMQLKRLVEMAGMMERCDFSVQEVSGDGSLRADMVITLPNARKIIVDAKVPLEGYIKAVETDQQDVYDREMKLHADHLEKHIKALADKKYWDRYQGAADFIVLFLPSEALLLGALSKRPQLLEKSLDVNVLIATPSTLMALLHAVAQGWRDVRVERDMKEIITLAKEWFDRCGVFVKHMQGLGKALDSTASYYNKAVSSFETRFLVTLRKLAQAQHLASGAIVEELEPISFPLAEMRPIEELDQFEAGSEKKSACEMAP